MTNTRGMVGAIFTAVIGLMNNLIGLFRTMDKGIVMLDVAVQDAVDTQEIRSTIDMETYETQYLKAAARKMEEDERAIEEYRSRSEAHRAGYDAALAHLTAALEKKRALKKKT